jgi:hypothetical protein
LVEVDIAAVAVAVGTAALIIITYVYVIETKKIRIAGQQPIFSGAPKVENRVKKIVLLLYVF